MTQQQSAQTGARQGAATGRRSSFAKASGSLTSPDVTDIVSSLNCKGVSVCICICVCVCAYVKTEGSCRTWLHILSVSPWLANANQSCGPKAWIMSGCLVTGSGLSASTIMLHGKNAAHVWTSQRNASTTTTPPRDGERPAASAVYSKLRAVSFL